MFCFEHTRPPVFITLSYRTDWPDAYDKVDPRTARFTGGPAGTPPG